MDLRQPAACGAEPLAHTGTSANGPLPPRPAARLFLPDRTLDAAFKRQCRCGRDSLQDRAPTRYARVMKPSFLPIFAAALLCGAPASFAKLSPTAAKRPAAAAEDIIVVLRARAGMGSVQAKNTLGFMYATGRGVPKDYAEALRWYRKAAAQGSAKAQTSLGLMYSAGWGVRKNRAEAVKWYRKAAEHGHALAQNNLGFAYAQGDGVRKDYAESVRWYRKGAEQGSAPAQNSLGFMYATGRGVPKNYAEAGKWFLLAVAQGQERAKRNYAILQRILGEEEYRLLRRLRRQHASGAANGTSRG